MDYRLRFDYDGSNGEFSHQFARSDIGSFSQELRLASSGDNEVDWLVGIEYGEDGVREDRDIGVADDAIVGALLGEAANLRYGRKTRPEIASWGRNLADEEYFVNVTSDDLASWMELPGEPRSYGVELRYQW